MNDIQIILLIIVVIALLKILFEFLKGLGYIDLSSIPHQIKVDEFLTLNSPYYKKLNKDERKRFLYRVRLFLQNKTFVGKKGFRMSDNVKLLISAASIQITFGLDNFLIPRFRTIFVYPEAYFNNNTKQYHKGEINRMGAIVLSWKHFLEGFNDYSDKLNVGLHEMAHALQFTIIDSNYENFQLNNYLEEITKISSTEIEKIKNNEHHFFRSYASQNKHEFFAVAIEHFFEAPEQFNQELPELYNYMCMLLRQDPCRNIFRIENQNLL